MLISRMLMPEERFHEFEDKAVEKIGRKKPQEFV
jgi:hypothetical protein